MDFQGSIDIWHYLKPTAGIIFVGANNVWQIILTLSIALESGEGGQGSIYKVDLVSWDIIVVKKFHPLPLIDFAKKLDILNENKALIELQYW